LKITAIDFETANQSRLSACSLGLAVLEDGVVTFRAERRIKPPQGHDYFFADFIGIHGITPAEVRNAPGFDAVFQEWRPHFDGALLAAHNAPFDLSVLRALLGHYGLSFSCETVCTLKLSRRCWPQLPRHTLPVVAAHLGVGLKHHDAGEDAYAAARIMLACLQENHATVKSCIKPFGV
jgi:DNA polymerase-3 subunit epsilon